MPQLAKKSFNTDPKEKEGKETKQEQKESTPKPKPKPTQSKNLLDKPMKTSIADADDNDETEEDEVISASVKNKNNKNSKNPKIIIGCFVGAAALIMGFLLFGGKKDEPSAPPLEDPSISKEKDTTPVQSQTPSTGTSTQSPTQTPENLLEDTPDDLNVGTQDFRQNTTMDSDTALTDPDNFIKDLYGLSLQTNFTVSKIQDATDFVDYTKRRGTWGGGLELYYLDAEYRGNKYVIQVPFKYYKELDDTGIVPVKMEVLRVKSEVDDTYLSIISYMCLDEKTLESVLKTQQKK